MMRWCMCNEERTELSGGIMKNAQLRLLAVISLVCIWMALSAIPARAQSWSNGYAFQRAITIGHANVPNTDQTDFPVLISGTYSFLATTANGGDVTNASGYDIIFTSDSAGSNLLPFERESYSGSTGAVVFWVQVPSLSHTTDTVIYMFYGNGAVTADPSNKTSVWGNNYVGVWHLSNGISLSGSDSTSNGYNLTNNNGVTATSGALGGAASFNGSNSYLSNSSLSIAAGSSLSISFWSYVPTADVKQQSAFTIGNSDNPNRIQAHAPWSDKTLYWDFTGTTHRGDV